MRGAGAARRHRPAAASKTRLGALSLVDDHEVESAGLADRIGAADRARLRVGAARAGDATWRARCSTGRRDEERNPLRARGRSAATLIRAHRSGLRARRTAQAAGPRDSAARWRGHAAVLCGDRGATCSAAACRPLALTRAPASTAPGGRLPGVNAGYATLPAGRLAASTATGGDSARATVGTHDQRHGSSRGAGRAVRRRRRQPALAARRRLRRRHALGRRSGTPLAQVDAGS